MGLGMCKYINVMQVQKCKFEGFFLRIPEILKLDRNALVVCYAHVHAQTGSTGT